jgi:hypothetical protein
VTQARTPASLTNLKRKIASRSQLQQGGSAAAAHPPPPPPPPSSASVPMAALTPSLDPIVHSPAASASTASPVVDVAAEHATAPRATVRAPVVHSGPSSTAASEPTFDSPAPTDPLSPSFFPPSAAPTVMQSAGFHDTGPPRSRLRQPAHAHAPPPPQQPVAAVAVNREPSFISCASCHARVENAVALVAHLLQCPAWALDADEPAAEGERGGDGVERALFASPPQSHAPALFPAQKLAASMRSAVGASRAKSAHGFGKGAAAAAAAAISPENPVNNTRPVSRLRQRNK